MATTVSEMLKREVGGEWRAVKEKYGLWSYAGEVDGVQLTISCPNTIPSDEDGYFRFVWEAKQGNTTIGIGLTPVDAMRSAKHHMTQRSKAK